jgi:hypothetical protein
MKKHSFIDRPFVQGIRVLKAGAADRVFWQNEVNEEPHQEMSYGKIIWMRKNSLSSPQLPKNARTTGANRFGVGFGAGSGTGVTNFYPAIASCNI